MRRPHSGHTPFTHRRCPARRETVEVFDYTRLNRFELLALCKRRELSGAGDNWALMGRLIAADLRYESAQRGRSS